MTVELEMKKSDPNCGEERLTEVRRSRNCQKGTEGRLGEDCRREGWISKTASDEPEDGILAPESGSPAYTCLHAPTLGT